MDYSRNMKVKEIIELIVINSPYENLHQLTMAIFGEESGHKVYRKLKRWEGADPTPWTDMMAFLEKNGYTISLTKKIK